MTIVRRIIAAAAVAGVLAVVPISVIAAATQPADQAVSVSGGQGSWPFKK